jgi:hypothetical protein
MNTGGWTYWTDEQPDTTRMIRLRQYGTYVAMYDESKGTWYDVADHSEGGAQWQYVTELPA